MEEKRAAVAKAIEEMTKPMEEIVTENIAKVKAQQQELSEKIQQLASDLEHVQSVLPPSNLEDLVARINTYCDRIEGCRKRVVNVSKKADTLLARLSRTKGQPKFGTLIDLS